MQLHPLAERILPQLVRWRRHLHRIAEVSGEEVRTQAYIHQQLEMLRPDVLEKCADTGLRCVFYAPNGAETARTLAFRADMDALAIQEETGLPYASKTPGVMHACGHDGHMAALLGLAACCATLRSAGALRANVVLLFQPAEESTGGAERMIRQGALENPHVDEILGLHMMPEQPLGCYSCISGAMMAADYEFDIEIFGKSAHGAMPQHGVNALDAAAALYGRLKAIAQLTAPEDLALLNIGRIGGGDARNIVPPFAWLECVTRTFSDEVLSSMQEAIQKAVKGVALSHGVVAMRQDKVYYPPVVNPEPLVSAFSRYLDGELITQKPLLIAEDYSFYQKERSGLFVFVGTRSPGYEKPLHSNEFAYEETALAYALNAHLLWLTNRSILTERDV